MKLDELLANIRCAVEDGFRRRGYTMLINVAYEGNGRAFASSPFKAPRHVWEEVLDEALRAGHWPMTVHVSAPNESEGEP